MDSVACHGYGSLYRLLVVASVVCSHRLQSSAFRLSQRLTSERLNNFSNSGGCDEPGTYCADSSNNGRCPKFRCLSCDLDPNELANGLSCKNCALDMQTKLPMCTECAEGLVAHVFDADAFGKKRWLCQHSSVKLGYIPPLCTETPASLTGDSLGELWKIQDEKTGTFVDRIVKMKEIEEQRGPSKDGGFEYVTIALAIYPLDGNSTTDWTFSERVFAFRLYKGDTWVRSSSLFRTHPEMIPSDTEKCVWYLDDAFPNLDGRLEVQVNFVKHAMKGQLQVTDGKVHHIFDRAHQIMVPQMSLTELAIQSLGACYEFWLKGRAPREYVPRPAVQVLYRAASFIDKKVEESNATFEILGSDSTSFCKESEYCTIGPPGYPCQPPGRCLPCHLDYTGLSNGLICKRCQLNTLNGIRFSVPSCAIAGEREMEPTCERPGDAIRMRDETNVRVRYYCRPVSYEPGKVPPLCQGATQGGLTVTSKSELWERQKEGATYWETVRARLLPLPDKGDGFIRAYFFFLPHTTLIVEDSMGHWAMAASMAKQMLMFKLRPADKLVSRFGSTDDSVFEYLGAREDMRGKTRLKIMFKKEIRDELNGEILITEKTTYAITKDSLLALAACIESFQKERVVTELEPEGYLDALELAGIE